MVYITGDTHGELERFKTGPLRRLTKHDTVIVLGDFGFVWDNSKQEQARLSWLKKRRYTIYFLDGSHENYDLLAQYPVQQQPLARVRHLGGNLYHVCRGSILQLEGLRYLCFGGAESPDRDDREPGINWWPQEIPTEEEYAWCRQNLQQCGYQVDYVLTHDAPSKFLNFSVLQTGDNTQLHSFLDEILLQLQYTRWYFGCYHKDVALSAKAQCVFTKAIATGAQPTKPRWLPGRR